MRPAQIARRNAEQRRIRVLAAAHRLFARQGFHSTGMAQIARESDVLVGQIYRDFAGKEDVIAAIVERDLAELLDDPELSEAIAYGDAGRLRDWVVRFIARTLDEETRCLFADIVSEATRNARIAAIMQQAHGRLRVRLAAASMVWLPQADRDADRQATAELILTLSGAMLYRQICSFDDSHDTVVARLVTMIDLELGRMSTASTP